mgnify:CR=1 FL=1
MALLAKERIKDPIEERDLKTAEDVRDCLKDPFGETVRLQVSAVIRATNIIERCHRQLTKVTKGKSIFPIDDALLRMLYLVTQDVTGKWTVRVRDWSLAPARLMVFFPTAQSPSPDRTGSRSTLCLTRPFSRSQIATGSYPEDYSRCHPPSGGRLMTLRDSPAASLRRIPAPGIDRSTARSRLAAIPPRDGRHTRKMREGAGLGSLSGYARSLPGGALPRLLRSRCALQDVEEAGGDHQPAVHELDLRRELDRPAGRFDGVLPRHERVPLLPDEDLRAISIDRHSDQRIRQTITFASQATPAARSFPSGEKSTDVTLSILLTFCIHRIRPVLASDRVIAPPTALLEVALGRAHGNGDLGVHGRALPPTATSCPSGEKVTAHGEPTLRQSMKARSCLPVLTFHMRTTGAPCTPNATIRPSGEKAALPPVPSSV